MLRLSNRSVFQNGSPSTKTSRYRALQAGRLQRNIASPNGKFENVTTGSAHHDNDDPVSQLSSLAQELDSPMDGTKPFLPELAAAPGSSSSVTWSRSKTDSDSAFKSDSHIIYPVCPENSSVCQELLEFTSTTIN